MLLHRRWKSLDRNNLPWLRAGYHFKVDASGNPEHSPLGPLYVWNDDEVAVGAGFPMHGHRSVEIVSYVRHGVLQHRDSLGSVGQLQGGEVQVMSAGTGIRHSESNHGKVPLRLYQIWLQPRVADAPPRWETRPIQREPGGGFTVLASGLPGDEQALPIDADARVLSAMLKEGERVSHPLGLDRQAYLVVAAGEIEIDGETMTMGDGAVILGVEATHITAVQDAELVMVEVA
jgi:redox-sensitive bicupin YhaK (pirin superfamily)